MYVNGLRLRKSHLLLVCCQKQQMEFDTRWSIEKRKKKSKCTQFWSTKRKSVLMIGKICILCRQSGRIKTTFDLVKVRFCVCVWKTHLTDLPIWRKKRRNIFEFCHLIDFNIMTECVSKLCILSMLEIRPLKSVKIACNCNLNCKNRKYHVVQLKAAKSGLNTNRALKKVNWF